MLANIDQAAVDIVVDLAAVDTEAAAGIVQRQDMDRHSSYGDYLQKRQLR